jgi:phenylacetate-coenzyme A ligase PaaK-like adenylate-forming protein
MFPRLDQLSALLSVIRDPKRNREDVVSFQNRQLRSLVTHAYENVPYYRRLFDRNGVKPRDIQTVADLPAIPITSKRDLQSLPVDEVVARGANPKSLISHTTSGSSGEPITVRRTWLEHTVFILLRRSAATHGAGLRTRDRKASIVLIRPTHHRDRRLALRIARSLRLPWNVAINCLLPPTEIVRRLRHFHPDVLTGFPGVISRVSQIISDSDRMIIRPRLVVVGGETLTPLMRTQITEAFSAPVFDFYASYEFGLIAWECRETGNLHTSDDTVIVEVLKNGRAAAPGERGELVGTNLRAFAMPFIRYRLGDIVTKGLEACQCGLPFSTIRTIQGRMLDYFPLPGGRVIHPYEISLLFLDSAPWMRQYQLSQEREDYIVMRVVAFSTPKPEEVGRLVETVKARLGPGVEFKVIFVPEIELEPSGKFRVSRSFVKSAYDGINWDQPETDRARAVTHADEPG